MTAFEMIKMRRSIRQFKDTPVAEEDIRKILEAGQAGPSACKKYPLKFFVVTDKKVIEKMAEGNGSSAEPLKNAPLGILICGDLNLAIDKCPEYYQVDCSIAAQNMLLTAHELGVGGCWIGTWPQEHKVEAQRKALELPDNLIPHSILALGYPLNEEELTMGGRSEYDESKVVFIEPKAPGKVGFLKRLFGKRA